MIQRIQTLYMFLAVVLCVACMSMGIGRFYTEEGEAIGRLYNLWMTTAEGLHSFFPWALFAILLLSATLLTLNIFFYKHQARQFRICVFSLILLVGWYAAYGCMVWMRMGQMHAHFRPEWPAAFPLVAIVLIAMGMRGITRDILLLRSLDRLR